MSTLQEALERGQGNERPFRCPVHDDSNASASVNVAKGVWYCFTCHAKGSVDAKKAPSVAELAYMMEPERNCRTYPDSYQEIFSQDIESSYWASRFPAWLCWWAGFGEDPVTGDGTFPVHTPEGRFAGVGRRRNDAEAQPRYKYPPRWSAARTLHGARTTPPSRIVVLVEGAADQVSLLECGISGRGCYGAGLHAPQLEQLMRSKPTTVLLGFDMDNAGHRASEMTAALLRDTGVEVARVEWPAKDPGDCSPEQRIDAVNGSVSAGAYLPSWQQATAHMQAAYESHLRELSEI